MRRASLAILCLAVPLAFAWWSADAGETAVRFEPVKDWPQLPADVVLVGVTGVAVDPAGQVYVFHRGKRPILVLSPEGKLVRSLGDGLVKTSHSIRLDSDQNLWITDLGHHTVTKLDRDGKVLLTLGTKGKAGATNDRFDRPADVAFDRDKNLFVADGYGNTRVMKFGPDGKYLAQWGTPGKGPGQFNLPHAIRVNDRGEIVVGDRENDRVQVFSPEGKYLREWAVPGGPFGIYLAPRGETFVAAGRTAKVRWHDAAGMRLGEWGAKGKGVGDYLLPHGICGDGAGHVYVGEVDGKRIRKFRATRS